jgi:cytochrome c oxidase subunit 3
MSTDIQMEKKKIHPYQFYLWGGLGSIVMMFAGLTSAYIVKKSQSNWLDFELPKVFMVSTVVILISSFTIQMAVKKQKEQNENQYKGFLSVTAILGVMFIILQIQGFKALEANSIALIGSRSNSAASFLFVITGLHVLHVVGGIIALIWINKKAFSGKNNLNNDMPVKLVSNYWHFVDILWIYIFVFLNWVG